ncbi:hypothetical protein ACQY0O_005432 [Thecaphora frezii]
MPSSLPDPVLALSIDNVLKLNDLDLDQLANLWNVFTKCKESLESGRRLENLSWRLWFREAHILPPDMALADLPDFTPMDTPLLSRANSVAGSYQHSRLSSLLGQASAALSDPELETDSSSSDSDGDYATPATAATAGRRQQGRPAMSRRSTGSDGVKAPAWLSPRQQKLHQPEAGPSRNRRVELSTTTSAVSGGNRTTHPRESDVAGPSMQARASELAADRDSQWDRKRAVSSSSAFGSRARVKQRNQSGLRRRPLSFQMAIESLYLDRSGVVETLARARPGLSRFSSDLIASTGAIDAPQRPRTADAVDVSGRFSAPAEYSSTAASSAHSSHRKMAASPASYQQTSTDRTAPAGDQHPNNARLPASDSPSFLGRSVEPCHAPETNGPISPSKMDIATAPTIGAISRQPSPSQLSAADAGTRRELEDTQLMPPPPFVPVRPAAAVSDAESQAVVRLSSTKDVVPPPMPLPNEAARAAPAPPAADKLQRETSSSFYLASPDSSSSVASSRPTLRPSRPSASAAPQGNGTSTKASAAHRGKAREGHAPQLHAVHRSKSSTGLHRDHRNHKSSERLPVKRNSQVRLGNLLSGLTMTKAAPAPAPAPAPPKRSTAAAPPAKKKPVQFTMGGDDSDSFEDEDDSGDEQNVPVQQQQQKQALAQPSSTKPAAAATADDGFEDADDDEWASDPEAEEAERQAQAAAEAERRRREEEEHQKAMFQKIPIRSKSAADVRLLPMQGQISAGPSPPQQPVRGLLSSLFHPDEQHSAPGQLAGRPHASAADLRAKPSLPSGLALSQKAAAEAPKKRSKSREASTGTVATTAAPWSSSIGSIRTSKSAVALPLLSTSVTRSATGGVRARQQQHPAGEASGQKQADLRAADDAASSSSHGSAGGKPSSVAMAKLNALAHIRSHADRHRQGQTEADAALKEAEARALRLEVSPSHDISSQTTATALQRHGADARSKSETGTGPMAAPTFGRHRSSIDLPETAAPQTPRTTRRNMLRDELSESLRQNLLWERQSRTRMLGIGAPVVKKETVLGGNQLRPLTSAHPSMSSSTSQPQNPKPKRHSEEWGSFHHKGW